MRRSGGKNRLPHEPADHALGRSRGGWGTKVHLVTDGAGLPLAVAVSAGQAHESLHAERTEVLLETIINERADLVYHPFRFETPAGDWAVQVRMDPC